MSPKTTAVLCSLLLIAAGIAPIAMASTSQAAQTQAYSGTHVAFDTEESAVVDYRVHDETVLQSVAVQSKSQAESDSGLDLGVSLSAVTDLVGAAVSLESKSELGATIAVDSGAEMHAHDNHHGVLVIEATSQDQVVQANVSSDADAEATSDSRVVVTTDSGTKGAFVVAGDGTVTVNDEGNVSAELAEDGNLVFRSYGEERDESDRKEERMIADGTAAAEVYIVEKTESGGEIGADVVNYSSDTSVEVTEASDGSVRMTADRAQSEGKVIITTVSEQAIDASDDVEVTVDGEAAARVSSYAEVRDAIGSDTSKYMVGEDASANGRAEVLVGVNHFSTREIVMSQSGSDGGDGGSGDAATETSTEDSDGGGGNAADGSGGKVPGFTAAIGVIAVVIASLIVGRRR